MFNQGGAPVVVAHNVYSLLDTKKKKSSKKARRRSRACACGLGLRG
jgi:hypothetical protein